MGGEEIGGGASEPAENLRIANRTNRPFPFSPSSHLYRTRLPFPFLTFQLNRLGRPMSPSYRSTSAKPSSRLSQI